MDWTIYALAIFLIFVIMILIPICLIWLLDHKKPDYQPVLTLPMILCIIGIGLIVSGGFTIYSCDNEFSLSMLFCCTGIILLGIILAFYSSKIEKSAKQTIDDTKTNQP